MLPASFDVLSGFLAFIAVLIVTVLERQNQDVRPFALAAYCVFFFAAVYRTRVDRPRRWLTPALVALGGIIPVVAMSLSKVAFTATTFLNSFLILGICGSFLGAGAKLLYSASKKVVALTAAVAALVTVVTVVLVMIPRLEEDAAYQQVNREVKPFTIETLTGETISSDRWKGHVVVLSFWATWCTPCQAELPQIATLQNRYRSNPKVLVYALDSGNHGDTSSKAQAYLTRKAIRVNPAIDTFGVDPASDSWGPGAVSLGVNYLPALFILDQTGRLRVIHHGYDSSEDLANSLARKVAELL